MKITQQIVAQFGQIPSELHLSGQWKERWSKETWKHVDECRQIVGYQSGEDWGCAGCGGTEEQQAALRSKYPGKYVCGGFICAPCIMKEMIDKQAAGLVIPMAET